MSWPGPGICLQTYQSHRCPVWDRTGFFYWMGGWLRRSPWSLNCVVLWFILSLSNSPHFKNQVGSAGWIQHCSVRTQLWTCDHTPGLGQLQSWAGWVWFRGRSGPAAGPGGIWKDSEKQATGLMASAPLSQKCLPSEAADTVNVVSISLCISLQ